MDNLKSPAYPTELKNSVGGNSGNAKGFTKLEMASLMIAQGFSACPSMQEADETFANNCVSLAKAVLEEANK